MDDGCDCVSPSDTAKVTWHSEDHTVLLLAHSILPSVDNRILLSVPRPHPMLTYSPSQKCGGYASVPRRSLRAPGVWELWPGPAAPNCSWRHGSIVCHSPATAASSAPEKCPLLCQTSLQDKTESCRWATCQASVLWGQSYFTRPWTHKPIIMSRCFSYIPFRIQESRLPFIDGKLWSRYSSINTGPELQLDLGVSVALFPWPHVWKSNSSPE